MSDSALSIVPPCCEGCGEANAHQVVNDDGEITFLCETCFVEDATIEVAERLLGPEAVEMARRVASDVIADEKDLRKCEEEIERGTETVRAALKRIRDQRLYALAGFVRFEDYLNTRWGISRRRAYEAIEAAEVEELAAPARERVCGIPHTKAPSEAALLEMAPLRKSPEALNRVAEQVYARGLTARETAELVTQEQGGREVRASDAVRSQREIRADDVVSSLESLFVNRLKFTDPHEVIQWTSQPDRLAKAVQRGLAWVAAAAQEIEEDE